jgi:hypothetical protein
MHGAPVLYQNTKHISTEARVRLHLSKYAYTHQGYNGSSNIFLCQFPVALVPMQEIRIYIFTCVKLHYHTKTGFSPTRPPSPLSSPLGPLCHISPRAWICLRMQYTDIRRQAKTQTNIKQSPPIFFCLGLGRNVNN